MTPAREISRAWPAASVTPISAHGLGNHDAKGERGEQVHRLVAREEALHDGRPVVGRLWRGRRTVGDNESRAHHHDDERDEGGASLRGQGRA